MATAGSLLSEEQFLCPICLDVFAHPVSTPCGHNFCRDCIQGYWQTTKLPQCPMCKHKFYMRPELKVNTFISEVADQFRRSVARKKDDSDATGQPAAPCGEVLCDVCQEGRKVKALKSCIDCLASYCETHLEPHRVLGTFRKHRLIDPVMAMQDRVCQKHNSLLELFCITDRVYVCQTCLRKHHKAHRTVPIEAECQQRKSQLGTLEAEVRQKIQARLQKVSDIQEVMQASRKRAEREVDASMQVFTSLLRCIKRGQAEVVEVIEGRLREAERQAEGLLKELEQEIAELRRSSAELKQLALTEDQLYFHKSFLSFSMPPATKDWSDTVVKSVVYVGTVRRAARKAGSQLEETLKAEVRRLCEAEIQRVQQCAVDVTLDGDTAHFKLILSESRKQVQHGDVALSLPDNPQRFYPGISVLGSQGFSSGRFYYEVQVIGKTEWDIGVCRESVGRKGGSTLNPDGGYWTLGLRNGADYWALASPPISLPLQENPQRIGVYVDMEGRQVSFYNVESRSHIYSFTGCSFNDRLFPYFNPRRNHGGINSAPLVITPVI